MFAKPAILFILHLPPPVHGAAMVGRYIHDSALINTEFDCRFINLTTASGMGDIGRFRLQKVILFRRLLREIRRAVRTCRPDLVYVTPNAGGGPFLKDYIVVRMLRLMGCRVVAHYHNKGVTLRQDRPVYDFLYRKFFKGLKVILLSERLWPDIRKYVRREDVQICPNGIPGGTAPARKPSDNTPKLLFMSNLRVEKGVLVLLDALKILKDKGIPFCCDIVGGETAAIDTTRLEKELIDRDLNAIVSYHGNRFGKEKDALLNQADMFVFPSFNECFPLVLLEAMSHALPCISTAEGAIPDILNDGVTGLIVRKNDPEDLADKLTTLLHDPALRERMGQAGRRKFEECFTLEHFERTFVDVLKVILNEEPSC